MQVLVQEAVTSTNELLYQDAKEGRLTQDMALLALNQTEGRGRRGRSFFSPEGTGLYLSLLLHPTVSIDKVTLITTMMAVAASRALESLGSPSIDLKWVNDLYIRKRKVGGILTVCSPEIEEGIPAFVVCGIGINIYCPEGGFPEDIEGLAGYVFDRNAYEAGNIESDRAYEHKELAEHNDLRLSVAGRIIEEFVSLYQNKDWYEHIGEYRKRSFLIGQRVTVLPAKEQVTVLSVDDEFRLVVKFGDGHTEELDSGEVSLVL